MQSASTCAFVSVHPCRLFPCLRKMLAVFHYSHHKLNYKRRKLFKAILKNTASLFIWLAIFIQKNAKKRKYKCLVNEIIRKRCRFGAYHHLVRERGVSAVRQAFEGPVFGSGTILSCRSKIDRPCLAASNSFLFIAEAYICGYDRVRRYGVISIVYHMFDFSWISSMWIADVDCGLNAHGFKRGKLIRRSKHKMFLVLHIHAQKLLVESAKCISISKCGEISYKVRNLCAGSTHPCRLFSCACKMLSVFRYSDHKNKLQDRKTTCRGCVTPNWKNTASFFLFNPEECYFNPEECSFNPEECNLIKKNAIRGTSWVKENIRKRCTFGTYHSFY